MEIGTIYAFQHVNSKVDENSDRYKLIQTGTRESVSTFLNQTENSHIGFLSKLLCTFFSSTKKQKIAR
ncbi:MAG: hypothetical protein D3924_04695 [Candidatus Electrothrix sp. AR4]|nr:hypothetical protein [Candidatus Electrothrix sp. AR4]